MDDFDSLSVALFQALGLLLSEAPANFDDSVSSTFVYFRMLHTQKVKDILGERPVSGTHLVDDKIFIREEFKEILGDEASGDRVAIIRLPRQPRELSSGSNKKNGTLGTLNSSVGVCHTCLPGPVPIPSSSRYSRYRSATARSNALPFGI